MDESYQRKILTAGDFRFHRKRAVQKKQRNWELHWKKAKKHIKVIGKITANIA